MNTRCISLLYSLAISVIVTVDHRCLMTALKEQGIDSKTLNIIRKIYEQATAHIKTDKTDDSFKIMRGVAQGDPLPPHLFNAVLEWIFKKLEWKEYGLKVDETRLNNLRFADDVVLTGTGRKEIQEMVKDIIRISGEAG